jgi:hypothetical protein
MDERLRFVACLLDGEKMAVVCREFGISRTSRNFNRGTDKPLQRLKPVEEDDIAGQGADAGSRGYAYIIDKEI